MTTKSRSGERGGALLLSVIISLAVMAISGAFISHSMIRSRRSFDSMMGLEALAAAESGAANQVKLLNMKLNNPAAPTVPGTVTAQKYVKDATIYRLWTENIGANGVDDNSDGVIDDSVEQNFVKLWVDGHAGGRWNATAGKYEGGATRTLEVILTGQSGGVFWNAIFAGNSSNDAAFQLEFGSGTANGSPVKDVIKGNVYSGGSLKHTGNAQLLNTAGTGASTQVMYEDSLTATSSQSPAPSYVQGSQPGLDIASQNYAAKGAAAAANDTASPDYDPKFVNVTTALNGTDARYSTGLETGVLVNGGTSQSLDGQGTQINKNFAATNPAHIFRKNVTDSGRNRAHQDYGTPTPRDDFFLEDSSTSPGQGSPQGNWLGSDGGQKVNIHPTGNDKIYYIEGNLWVANSSTYTFQFKNMSGTNQKTTFIVKGNLYFCDNVLYERDGSGNIKNPLDGMAFIAINDNTLPNATPQSVVTPGQPGYDAANVGLTYDQRVAKARDFNKVNGSGNIFFGDPAGGTTERFEAFLYAENNFYDNNLGAGGTNLTNIYGNMTAGNQVQIKRVITNFKPTQVTLDEGIMNGTKSLPGLPGNPSVAGADWKIASWRQVPGKPLSVGP